MGKKKNRGGKKAGSQEDAASARGSSPRLGHFRVASKASGAPRAPEHDPSAAEPRPPPATSKKDIPRTARGDGNAGPEQLNPADHIGGSRIPWNRPRMAEKLLVHMRYELVQHGSDIPFDSIARRLYPGSSGKEIQEFLDSTRMKLLAEGHLVPPTAAFAHGDIRGFVRPYLRTTTRPVRFDEPFEDALSGNARGLDGGREKTDDSEEDAASPAGPSSGGNGGHPTPDSASASKRGRGPRAASKRARRQAAPGLPESSPEDHHTAGTKKPRQGPPTFGKQHDHGWEQEPGIKPEREEPRHNWLRPPRPGLLQPGPIPWASKPMTREEPSHVQSQTLPHPGLLQPRYNAPSPALPPALYGSRGPAPREPPPAAPHYEADRRADYPNPNPAPAPARPSYGASSHPGYSHNPPDHDQYYAQQPQAPPPPAPAYGQQAQSQWHRSSYEYHQQPTRHAPSGPGGDYDCAVPHYHDGGGAGAWRRAPSSAYHRQAVPPPPPPPPPPTTMTQRPAHQSTVVGGEGAAGRSSSVLFGGAPAAPDDYDYWAARLRAASLRALEMMESGQGQGRQRQGHGQTRIWE